MEGGGGEGRREEIYRGRYEGRKDGGRYGERREIGVLWVATGSSTYHIEDGGEGASNVVEGHTQIFEGQVVEGDHPHKDNRQGHNLATRKKTMTSWGGKITHPVSMGDRLREEGSCATNNQ